MQPDWNYVKQTTLWEYEDLLQKLNAVLRYPVIRQAYNHSMPQAADFALRLFPENDQGVSEYTAGILASMQQLHQSGVADWADLLEKIGSRKKVVTFLTQTPLAFEQLIKVLHYLLRWGFPFYTAIRELLDHDSPHEMPAYTILKRLHLACSFDLLERGTTAQQRADLAALAGLPQVCVDALVHRADLARLPFVRRKTILPLCGAGYNTLARLAAADRAAMDADMQTYFASLGKQWADYKSVIILRGLIAGARALPPILIN